jgi:hypothetical protein
MFHVILRRDDGNLITYPNSMLLQKAVIKIEHPYEKPVQDEQELIDAKDKPATDYFKGLKTVRD